jgi:hypothetical protein
MRSGTPLSSGNGQQVEIGNVPYRFSLPLTLWACAYPARTGDKGFRRHFISQLKLRLTKSRFSDERTASETEMEFRAFLREPEARIEYIMVSALASMLPLSAKPKVVFDVNSYHAERKSGRQQEPAP